MINDLTSLLTSAVVIPVALMACYAYRRSAGAVWRGGASAVDWFGHGVFTGFAALALNTLWWGLMLRSAMLADAVEAVAFMRSVGGFVDLVVKGLGGWAAYCHLLSLWMRIPESDRRNWTPWSVAFYPNLGHVIARTLNTVIRPK